MSSLLLRDLIDRRFNTPHYIQFGALSSYRHWWNHLGWDLDLAYQHIFRPGRRPKRKWSYGRGPVNCTSVSHTVVLPTGEEITYEWVNPHNPHWRRRNEGKFREKHAFIQHGVEKKQAEQARADWRERKGFTKDKAKRHQQRRCPKWMKQMINRENRHAEKRMIHQEDWDHLFSRSEPRDTWRWD